MAALPAAPHPHPPRGAEAIAAGRAAFAAAALLLLGAGPTPPATPGPARPSVMLMTGLPLVWGEIGPFDPASRPAVAYVELRERFAFQPVDVLDAAGLERGRLLFLAQPHRLAPAELAAIDGWIRRGGRALILTDPLLAWPSALPPGDIRRPPPVGLLRPLLDHWRLALEAPAAPGEVTGRWNGRSVALDSPGRLRSAGADCVVGPEDWTALCRLGRGQARVVADADLMRDSLWQRRSADNDAVVGEWLDELAGRPLRRPGVRNATAALAALALILIAAAVAAGLLLLLRRKR